ncbi:uncharacterized protein LOC128234300 [Mya arenaria]|nr:uncharacterized protein LOC128234300 [Mya arenaria]XP_052804426.1 uncharacterized protein LOC128234300 [Mya arenaria]
MAALLRSTDQSLKEFGRNVTISEHPLARLMYYFDCICAVMDVDKMEYEGIDSLRKYHEFETLEEDDIDNLVKLCYELSPKALENAIFQDDGMCEDSNNNFFELKTVRNNFLVSESVLIGGIEMDVKKVMTYKICWLMKNWVRPMDYFAARLIRISSGQTSLPGYGNGGFEKHVVQEESSVPGKKPSKKKGKLFGSMK